MADRSASVPPAAGLARDARDGIAVGGHLIGRTIGGCRITGLIGRGGMGSVYRARHLVRDCDVAFKVILPGPDRDRGLRQRFLREARLAGSIDHPHVIRILDAGSDPAAGGLLYLTMELVDGITLEEALDHGPLPPAMVATLLRAAADGLQAIEAQGLVHRDITPGNLMIDGRGRLVIMDFGLARPCLGGADLTTPGSILGTPAFLAPETIRGDDLDIRSDLYSLGATAWHALTGRPPFHGTTAVQVMVQHLDGVLPDLDLILRHRATGLAALVTGMLAKRPEGRPASPGVLAQTLETIESGLGGPCRLELRSGRIVGWTRDGILLEDGLRPLPAQPPLPRVATEGGSRSFLLNPWSEAFLILAIVGLALLLVLIFVLLRAEGGGTRPRPMPHALPAPGAHHPSRSPVGMRERPGLGHQPLANASVWTD